MDWTEYTTDTLWLSGPWIVRRSDSVIRPFNLLKDGVFLSSFKTLAAAQRKAKALSA